MSHLAREARHRIVARATAVGLLVALQCSTHPRPASGQFAEPCDAACALTLGATGFTVAMGSVVALSRLTGGISTTGEGLWTWGSTFTVLVGGGVALSGNGERQQRAVYAGGIGALAGSLIGLGIESSFEGSNGSRKLAATLMGAAAGAVLAGVYGAVGFEGVEAADPLPLFGVSLGL